MIKISGTTFHLITEKTSYILRVDSAGHLRHEYYGSRQPEEKDYSFVYYKENFPKGSAVVYDEKKFPGLSYDQIPLEISTPGKGDYRDSSVLIEGEHQSIFDFCFVRYELLDQFMTGDFPSPHTPDQVLMIELVDKNSNLCLQLQYGIFEQSNVIARNITLLNQGKENYRVNKIMSMNLDFSNHNYQLWTTYGGWINEFNISRHDLIPGIFISDSKTGSSSARHNPFFLLSEKSTTMMTGAAYAFNLIYSGNHYMSAELTSFGNVRLESGINPIDFHPIIKEGEKLSLPFSVMSFAMNGINSVSQNMHQFIRKNVVRKEWSNRDRPIVVNNWEATYFKFNESKLAKIIAAAKKSGLEMFVLDDGWFGKRNNDLAGLGDWKVNRSKLPGGLKSIAKKAGSGRMKFGLWFEPEMVNEDSDLYREHPDWAIKTDYYIPSVGRHQLMLDLSRNEVQDYIIESLSKILSSADISYVKWDFNRTISDGESHHTPYSELTYRYYIGLYRVMKALTDKFPKILFENCASGGGRFDLGMMSYFDQTWTSDCTDSYERIKIQSGTALGYPLSVISNHVSAVPSHQMLRITPFASRFNVAAFGVLGYELDLAELVPLEQKWLRDQLRFYKAHRHLFQFGTFYQLKRLEDDGYALWEVISEDKSEAIIGYFQGLQKSAPGVDQIKVVGLINEREYVVNVLANPHQLKTFGGLLKMVLPPIIKPDGLIINYLNKHQSVEHMMKMNELETYHLSGAALNAGALIINPQWEGTGVDAKTRVLGDFGSNLIYIQAINKEG